MAKEPKTPVQLSATEKYRAVIRYIHFHKEFDRLGLGFVTGQPFGNGSRIISTLINEGYLAKTGHRMVYERSHVDNELFFVDTDEKGHHLNWNYGESQRRGRSTSYVKTEHWNRFMQRYHRFLKTGKDPGRRCHG